MTHNRTLVYTLTFIQNIFLGILIYFAFADLHNTPRQEKICAFLSILLITAIGKMLANSISYTYLNLAGNILYTVAVKWFNTHRCVFVATRSNNIINADKIFHVVRNQKKVRDISITLAAQHNTFSSVSILFKTLSNRLNPSDTYKSTGRNTFAYF